MPSVRTQFYALGVCIFLSSHCFVEASNDVASYNPASRSGSPTSVLLLIPGYNGSGEAMLDARWRAFAEKHGVILLAPAFKTTSKKSQQRRGYYYPERGSGVQTDKILIFGFSAGAHFAHRFALWKPEQVKAFVAYSAAWWSEPTKALRTVSALIICGEVDEPRFEPTKEFFERGHTHGRYSIRSIHSTETRWKNLLVNKCDIFRFI